MEARFRLGWHTGRFPRRSPARCRAIVPSHAFCSGAIVDWSSCALCIKTDDQSEPLETEDQGADDLESSANAPSEEDAEHDQFEMEAVDEPETSAAEEEDVANVPEAVKIGEGRYSLDGSSLSVLLHPEVIRTIRGSIPPNTDGGRWKPVLTVDPNGAMSVHWEPVE